MELQDLPLFITITLSLFRPSEAHNNIVCTNDGIIEGERLQYNDFEYLSYRGIPYAEPPTGNLRFMPPVPKKSWNGTLDATKQRAVCPQAENQYKKDQMSEDCLFLNVYVPLPKTKDELLAVMFYIHGGEFSALSGYNDVVYGPQLFLKEDIVVVTFNYRLGALGFLSLNRSEASGNAGLKDAILALKWVKRNIQFFRGDANKITLGGNSAGAALAHYLMLSHSTSGLFQRAFLVSGSALGYRFLARHPVENAIALSKQLGIESADENQILLQLKEADAFAIVEAQSSLGNNDKRKGFRPFAPFVPCIETESQSAVITDEPINIIKSGIPQNVPTLTGFNNREGFKMLPANLKNESLIEELNSDFELCIPSDIEYPLGSEISKNLAHSIKKFYFNGENISKSNVDEFIDLITDTQFYHAADYWIKLHKEQANSSKLYYYEFNYDGGLNWFKLTNDLHYPGTAHADELGYLFVTYITAPLLQNATATDNRVINNLLTLWSDFVKYGSPTSAIANFTWPQADESRGYLLLNDRPAAKAGPPLPTRSEFWEKIYEDYYEYKNKGGIIEPKIVP